MTNSSKARGSQHEREVCRYLNAHGFPHAERMPAGAQLDRGDLSGVIDLDGDKHTVEIKRWRDQSQAAVAQWCREAITEAENAGTVYWLVVGKRWGSGDAGDSPVWLPTADLMGLGLGETIVTHRMVSMARALHTDPDSDMADFVAQITLRAWCALAGGGS